MKCKVYDIKEEADTTTGSKYTQSGIKLRYIFYHCVFKVGKIVIKIGTIVWINKKRMIWLLKIPVF